MLRELVDGVLLLLSHDLSDSCELFLGQFDGVCESLLSPLLLELGKRSGDETGEVLSVLGGAWVGLQVGDGGMVVDAMPLTSCRILVMVGESWPSCLCLD